MARKNNKKHFISALLTVLVIGFLFLAGPASAVEMKIEASKTNPNEGEDITFTAQMDIEDNERVPVNTLEVVVYDSSGNEQSSCEFYPNGNKVSGSCDSDFGIITPVNTGVDYQNPSAGFGYGYGYDSSSGFGYYNQTFGYGYGYGYGYSISASDNSEFKYTMQWEAPSVSADSNFNVRFYAHASDGTNTQTYVSSSDLGISVTNVVSGGGGGSSSSDDDDDSSDSSDDSTDSSDSSNDGSGSDSGSDGSGSSGGMNDGSSVVETKETRKARQSILKDLGINEDDVESFEQVGPKKVLDNIEEITDEEISKLPPQIREAVEKFKASGDRVSSKSKATATVYEIKKKDGTTEKVVRVTKEVQIDMSSIGQGVQTVKIVEVIPKEVAQSASRQILGDFKILEDDPVIEFTVPVSQISNGVANIQYDILNEGAENLVSGIKSVVVADTVANSGNGDTSVNTGDVVVDTPSEEESGSNVLLIVIIGLLVILGIGAIIYFVFMKK